MKSQGDDTGDEKPKETAGKHVDWNKFQEHIRDTAAGIGPLEQVKKSEHAKSESPDKMKELEDRLLRLQADFENYKKRSAKENEALRENAGADVLLKLLPVVDDFELAMAHLAGHKDKPGAEFVRGMELIYAKLKDTLKRDGVEEMKALGEKFDPYRHDAIRQGEGDEGRVTEVVQKGYTLRGKVLRHAKVVVGKGKEGK